MGLRLNEEAEAMALALAKGRTDAPALPTQPAPPVIRSAWMG